MKLDQKAKYQETHEWARQEEEVIVVGLTDHAQESLSDIVFVELPEVGDSFDKGDAFGVVESVKAASDLYMPVSGEIVEINEALEDQPEMVNEDPYNKGWFIKVDPSSPGEWDELMSPEEYKASVSE
jgi:glycine cleavage system H protein